MTDEERLEELLDRWDALQEQGQDSTPEEVCRDCPEYLDRFRERLALLARFDAAFGTKEYQPPTDEEAASIRAGRFRGIRFHKAGGLGEVFRAQDEELQRLVALKRVKPLQAESPQRRQRFVFEALITGSLDHPGVVPIYGLGQDAQGNPCYAMRFVEGQTLGDSIEEFHRTPSSRVDPGERERAFQKLLNAFLTVCRTIAYAHSRGVVHRDLKPSNILLGEYGEVLVVDWGLAKLLQRTPESSILDEEHWRCEAPELWGTIGRAGSPPYMSPEQAEGRGDVGTASDIYSLGATLYHLLCGQPAFDGTYFEEVVEKVGAGTFAAPRAVEPSVPPALEAICLKAMQLRPTDRYPSALELAADIELWLVDEPVSAWREPWIVRQKRWLKRHRTVVATLVALCVAALLSLFGFAAQQQIANRRISQERDEARRQRDLAREHLYLAHLNAASRALEANHFERAHELLAGQLPQPGAGDHRGLEWSLLWSLGHRAIFSAKPLNGAAGSSDFALSPDGKTIVEASDASIKLWDVAAGSVQRTLPADASGPWQVALSPDGGLLAALNSAQLEVWDLQTGAARWRMQPKVANAREEADSPLLASGPIGAVAFSRDGNTLALGFAGENIALLESGTGNTLAEFSTEGGSPASLTFSRTGDRLAALEIGGTGSAIKLWNLASRAPEPSLKVDVGPSIGEVQFSADDRLLAACLGDRLIFIDAVSGEKLSEVEEQGWQPFRRLAFSPDNLLLATAGADRAIRIWGNGNAGSERRPVFYELSRLLGQGTGDVVRLAFARDGTTLFSGGSMLELWDMGADREAARLGQWRSDGTLASLRQALFTPEADALITGDQSGMVAYTDVRGARRSLSLENAKPGGAAEFVRRSDSGVDALGIAPDGKTLAVSHRARSGSMSAERRNESLISLWQIPPGQAAQAWQPRAKELKIDGQVQALAFSHVGDWLATSHAGGGVRLWRLPDRVDALQAGRVLPGHDGAATGLAFSPDSAFLAASCLSISAPAVSTLRLWDMASLTELPMTADVAHAGSISALAFAPDGSTLVLGTDSGQLLCLDVDRAGVQRLRFSRVAHNRRITAIAVAHTQRLLACGSADGSVSLWNYDDGQQFATLHLFPRRMTISNPVIALAFRPADQSLLAATALGNVAVCRPASAADVYAAQLRLVDQKPSDQHALAALAAAASSYQDLLSLDGKLDEARSVRETILNRLRASRLASQPDSPLHDWIQRFEARLVRSKQ